MAKSKSLTVALNSISNFSGFAISIVLGIISYPIIIDRIGIEAVGVYALIMAILAPMDLTNMGFAEATIKYVAQFKEVNDQNKVEQYISTTLLMSIVVGLIGMIIISVAGPSVATAFFDFKSESYETIQICFVIVAIGWLVRQLTSVFLSIPTAFQKFKIVALGNTVSSILSTSSILVTLVFFNNLIGYALGTLIGAILSLFFWFLIRRIKFSTLKFSIRFHGEIWRSAFSYGGWQTISSIGGLVTNQTDKYLLGFYLPPAASGVYNTIFQIQQRILSAIWKIAEVLFPLFSATSQKNYSNKFNSLIRSNYIISAIGVIVFFPLIILAYPALKIWINPQFAESGYVVMSCLLMVGTFASITVAQSFFLLGNAKVKQLTLVTYFTGAVTAIVSILLIPRYGLSGASYGVLLAAVTRTLLFYFLVKSFFKEYFNVWEYLISTAFPLIPGLLIVIFFTTFQVLDPQNIITLIIDYIAICVILLIFIISINFLTPMARSHNYEMLKLFREIKGLVFKKIPE